MEQSKCPDNYPGCCVAHGWACTKCMGHKVDHEAFLKTMSKQDFEPDKGFFYCPYIPDIITQP